MGKKRGGQKGAIMSENTLAELFSRDPLHFNKHPEDLDTIIAEYIEKRKLFSVAGKAPPTKRSVDLTELGLL